MPHHYRITYQDRTTGDLFACLHEASSFVGAVANWLHESPVATASVLLEVTEITPEYPRPMTEGYASQIPLEYGFENVQRLEPYACLHMETITGRMIVNAPNIERIPKDLFRTKVPSRPLFIVGAFPGDDLCGPDVDFHEGTPTP